MADGLTLDQLRVLVAIDETGSFSAAGRSLRRAQSGVSYAIAHLEDALGVALFDRTTRRPTLTAQGQAVLAEARQVLGAAQQLVGRARSFADGVETELALVVDVMVPLSALVAWCRAFGERWPAVTLRVDTEVLYAVPERVKAGAADIAVGVTPPVSDAVAAVVSRPLARYPLVTVVGASHPLAERRRATVAELARSVQIVMSDRSTSSEQLNVVGDCVWRVAEMRTKHALISAGLGWGNLPLHLVQDELDAGTLSLLQTDVWQGGPPDVRVSTLVRRDRPPGPAGRWLLAHLHGDPEP